jgi:hypothetical protein
MCAHARVNCRRFGCSYWAHDLTVFPIVHVPGDRELLVLVNGDVSAAKLDAILLWFSKCGEIEKSTQPQRVDGSSGASALHNLHSMVIHFGDDDAVDKALSFRSKKPNPAPVTQICLDAYRFVLGPLNS